jgi:3-oxoacyl-[acyl-carrier-protein] synthase III
MSVIRAVPIGIGHYLPNRIVENKEFEKSLDTSDDWIKARSGIERRHFAADTELTSDLGFFAAQSALKDASLNANEIDAIIVATSTPDLTFPSTATRIQHQLGMTTGFAFDIQAVCAGFVFALANANALILSGQAKRVMVIGAETFSRIMNWKDRSTCVLFGDGAGALILEAQEGTGDNKDRGIIATDLNSDGSYRDILYVDGGVSKTQSSGVLVMEGKEVYKHAVVKLAQTADTVLTKAKIETDDIDWVVPHQANLRIIKSTVQKLGIDMSRVIVTVQNHGNTSAASIPLALSVANQENKIKKGDLLLTEAIGGGLAWGSVVVRW